MRYLQKAKIKIKIKPTTHSLVSGSYTPSIEVKITNLGATKTEVDDIFFEFKKRSNIGKCYDDNYDIEIIWPLEPNYTKKQLLYCSKIYETNFQKDFKIIRAVVITTSDQVFRSKWMDCNNFKDIWSVKTNRSESHF